MAERIGVVGATGYAGALAATLIARHPRFELGYVTARAEAGEPLARVHPRTRVDAVLEVWDLERHAEVDAAIVAYPHAAAAPVVAALRERGVRVVDLSADFRLRDRATYEAWYGPHGAPELLGAAVYGLPERERAAIAGADLVANPGCYPTATLLALAPVADVLESVVVDAKSGVSGAGREPTAATHFIAADENMNPYKVGGHRHTPEIEQELGGKLKITFVPHLVPLAQGELVSCYVTTSEPVDAGRWTALYADEPFVEVVDHAPGVAEVRDTNYCRIFVAADERTGRTMVFAAIDNLWKGAASQALQNLNLMFGRPETEGLL